MGVMFIGCIFDAILYGILVFQVYRYYLKNHDRLLLRMLVGALYIIDSFQLVLVVHAMWHWLIANFDDRVALGTSIWSLNVEVGTTVVITFMVRCFFTGRLWRLSGKNRYMAGFIIILNLVQLGLGMAMVAICFIIMQFDKLPHFLAPVAVQLGVAVLADLCITSSLVYYLNSNRTGFGSTNSLINRLIVWSVNTALITTIFELVVLITWVTMPEKLYFVAFHLVVGKLYSNSLLAMLNGRDYLNSSGQSSTVLPSSRPVPFSALSFRAVLPRTSNLETSELRESHIDDATHYSGDVNDGFRIAEVTDKK
ncbi:hypothetical protein PLICRDRAFT_40413 [Plicaturopsis crispa FD-325 SS-3]|nr:hypothetical protein PLICRDRAFT_40413 [Plicaturopsis crispa FD-325 SS-3]